MCFVIGILLSRGGKKDEPTPNSDSNGSAAVLPASPNPPKVVPNSPEAKAAIETAIRQAAGKPTGELIQADLSKVTKLDLHDKGITDISPLSGCIKLLWLDLSVNQISSLKPLTGMKDLEVLWLGDNQIIDLKPLAGMTKLKRLALDENPVADPTPLYGLTELRNLGFTLNPNLTKAEGEKLGKALPNCAVGHDFN